MIKKFLFLLLSIFIISPVFAGDIYIDGQTNEGHIIQNNGKTLPQQPVLNFKGNLTAANSGSKTEVTIDTLSLIATLDALYVPYTGATGDVLLGTYSLSVVDSIYGVGWDGNSRVPTQNAVYDKIETISAVGDVTDVGDCATGACFTGTTGNTLTFKGATSGTIAFKPTAIAGTNTITMPAETGTVITSVTALGGDATGTVGAVVVGDDSHAHTTTTLSGIDISADTNLAVSTPITLTDDSVGMVNQGTTTTVLHGNAAGNPSFGAIVSADITDGTITAADTALTGGVGIDILTNDLVLDLTEVNSATFGSGTFTTLTFDAGASDPVWTYSSGVANLSTGTLQAGGQAVYTAGGTDVAVADGGTGKSSWTQYLIPYADTTTSFSQIAIGTSGQVLTSNGVGVAPSFQAASGANTALSNLAAVAINTSLISDTNNTDDLGSSSIKWANIHTVNALINGASVGTSGVGVLAIAKGTIPSSSPASETQLYSQGDYVAGLSATGGTITDVAGDKVHTFNSNGTFTVTGSGNVKVLVVGGGGGGGVGSSAVAYAGGGGGGGGIVYNASYAVTTGDYTVTVGAGGAGSESVSNKGSNGGDSVFGTITGTGGGGGGSTSNATGANGGCGGGGSASTAGGTGSQGYNGGTGGGNAAGGGGGMGAVGADATSSAGGNGGAGTSYTIQTDSALYYSGGGGGSGSVSGGTGGSSVGGNGGVETTGAATAGTTNRGGGGGGGSSAVQSLFGKAGGSGVVIIRFTPVTPSGAELKVRDELGNITTLSPHNFSNMPQKVINQVKKDSNDLAWTYHAEKDKKEITVDMFNAIKDLEKVTGKKYIYTKE